MRPRGIVEDVLIKVQHLIFPIDLIVLDTKEDDKGIPLILGRSFLRTARTIIDVYEGKLTLRIGDDSVEFNFNNEMKYPPEVADCWNVSADDDFFDDLTDEYVIPSLEKYTENIISKEEEKEELSKNEKDFKTLMRIEEIKDVKKPKTKKSEKKESCAFLRLFDDKKPLKKAWWQEEYERCYAVWDQKEEEQEEEQEKKLEEKPVKKKRIRKKVKSSFSRFQPRQIHESVIKKELNRALNNCLKMWIRKQKKKTNLKDPP